MEKGRKSERESRQKGIEDRSYTSSFISLAVVYQPLLTYATDFRGSLVRRSEVPELCWPRSRIKLLDRSLRAWARRILVLRAGSGYIAMQEQCCHTIDKDLSCYCLRELWKDVTAWYVISFAYYKHLAKARRPSDFT